MFKVINKLILSIVSIGLSFSFFKKDPCFRFEKNIDNKKESFHNRFKQDTGGRLSYSDFISDKGFVYFSFYDVSFDNFYYDEYLNLNFQGLDFKDNNSYVRLRTRFKVNKNEIYCSDYTYKENRTSNSSSYINYIVDRKDNFLYIKFVLEEVKDFYKKNKSSIPSTGKKEVRVDINFPKTCHIANAAYCDSKEFRIKAGAKTFNYHDVFAYWKNTERFVVEVDKIHDTWWDYMYPLYLLRAITSSKYGRAIGPIGNEKYTEHIITGIDENFGDYYYKHELAQNGRFLDYQLSIRFFDERTNLYEAEKDITIRLMSKDDISPRIIIDGISADSYTKPIQVSYDKARDLKMLKDSLLERIEVSDNSMEVLIPKIEIEGFKPMSIEDYVLTISSKDASENSTLVKKILQIIDDIPPAITSKVEKIETTINDRLSEEFILSKFRSVDEIDEELNVYLGRDEYHENMNYMKAGRYNVEIKAKDKSENETAIIFPITVFGSGNENYILSEGALIVSTDTILEPDEIVDKLIEAGQIDKVEYKEANIIEGNPIDGNNQVGEYTLKIEIVIDDNESRYVYLKIKVVEGKLNDIGNSTNIDNKGDSSGKDIKSDEESTPKSFWQHIVDFFKAIGDFFKNLFGIK